MLLEKINKFIELIKKEKDIFCLSVDSVAVPHVFEDRIESLADKIFESISFSDLKSIGKSIDKDIDLDEIIKVHSHGIGRARRGFKMFFVPGSSGFPMPSMKGGCDHISVSIFKYLKEDKDKYIKDKYFKKICIFFVQYMLIKLSENEKALTCFLDGCSKKTIGNMNIPENYILNVAETIGVEKTLEKFGEDIFMCSALLSPIRIVGYSKSETDFVLSYLNEFYNREEKTDSRCEVAKEMYITAMCFLDSSGYNFKSKIFETYLFGKHGMMITLEDDVEKYLERVISSEIKSMHKTKKFEFALKISEIDPKNMKTSMIEVIVSSIMDSVDHKIDRAAYIVPLNKMCKEIGVNLFTVEAKPFS